MTVNEKTEVRKQKILEAATSIFAQKGFQDATISEIAKLSAISEASVYDYYNTKENLLFSIPQMHVKRLQKELEFHLKLIRGAMNKLHASLYMHLYFYNENPDFAAVLLLILKHNRRFIDTEAHQEIRKSLKIIDRIIDEGINNGEFSSDINPYYVRVFMIGALEHIVINWLMRNKPKNLMDAFEPLFEIGLKIVNKEQIIPDCPLIFREKGKNNHVCN